MKPLTTSVYTFSNLIEGGYLYVDKTAGIHSLIKEASGQYVLSRPRRFGKSLLVSTLKAIFQGRRELFDGLALAKTDYNWRTYPVIHLDLGTAAAQTPEELEERLCYTVDSSAKTLDVPVTRKRAAGRFQELIDNLADRHGKVVILVDEYDKPLLGHLGNPAVAEFQRILKEFYSVIKTTEAQQRFALLTGVSKFSKVSVFSDLNNLTDLTMSRHAATLLGYTQDELEHNFPDYIEALAGSIGKTVEATLADLRGWYNGYRFEEKAETVYNPVSVMKCFQELKFKNYWFETGTPTFLIELLRRKPVDLGKLTAAETDFSLRTEPSRAAAPAGANRLPDDRTGRGFRRHNALSARVSQPRNRTIVQPLAGAGFFADPDIRPDQCPATHCPGPERSARGRHARNAQGLLRRGSEHDYPCR